MVEQFILEIRSVESIPFFLVMTLARPFGFFTSFVLIGFGLRRGVLLRIGASISLGLPVMVQGVPEMNSVFSDGSLVARAFLPPKEAVIGFCLGFIASLPFFAFQFAGHLCDSYRGEGSNGLTLTTGEPVTTIALIFFLLLSLVFLSDDGLIYLTQAFYGSYGLWGLSEFWPRLQPGAVNLVIELLISVFLMTVRVGLPLLLILFLTEIFLIVAARLGRRYGFNNFSFVIKNIAVLFSIPIYLVHVALIAEEIDHTFYNPVRILSLVFL